jgi:hypothetical protein
MNAFENRFVNVLLMIAGLLIKAFNIRVYSRKYTGAWCFFFYFPVVTVSVCEDF